MVPLLPSGVLAVPSAVLVRVDLGAPLIHTAMSMGAMLTMFIVNDEVG
jgi:hypothetical protein